MIAFQFPTEMTVDGDLALPRQYRRAIPPGSSLQVVLLVDTPTLAGSPDLVMEDEESSIEAYVAALQQRPLPQTLLTTASGLLDEHLAYPCHAAEADFDEAQWNAQWDQLETAVNADEWHGEQSRQQAIREDLP